MKEHLDQSRKDIEWLKEQLTCMNGMQEGFQGTTFSGVALKTLSISINLNECLIDICEIYREAHELGRAMHLDILKNNQKFATELNSLENKRVK